MSRQRAYLDCNATAPLRPEARAAALSALDLGGNASAVYGEGRKARALIEEARQAVANLVNAKSEDVIFTSGGSESAATCLMPGFKGVHAAPAERLIVTSIEHSAVLKGGRFNSNAIQLCPVTPSGVIDLAALEKRLVDGQGAALIAVMLANNETGIVQPVADVAALARHHGAALICDGVQAVGKIDVDIAALGVDGLILSGHKLGAPQGSGAIVLAEGAKLAQPLIKGGAQENRLRAGTENVSGIVGLGAACRAIALNGTTERARILALRQRLEAALTRFPVTVDVVGADMSRLPNTSLILADGVIGETAVIALDLAGVSVATGSACASGKVTQSHVLAALGIAPERARYALRISLGWSTSEAEIDHFLAAFAAHCADIAARSHAA